MTEIKPPYTVRKVNSTALRVLQVVVDHKRSNNGQAPTLREIRDASGLKSTSHVTYCLNVLEDAGLIMPREGTKGIWVVGSSWVYNGH